MLIDNINYLKKYQPELREYLLKKEYDQSPLTLKKVETRSGNLTLQVATGEVNLYLHSSYDPVKEAKQFIKQYDDEIKNYNHILFYGIGLGYQIKAFMKKHPEILVTLYEPHFSIAEAFFEHVDIKEMNVSNIDNIHIEENETKRHQVIRSLLSHSKSKLLIIALPSYQRLFRNELTEFMNTFKNMTKSTRTSLKITSAYERRWVYNSAMNFPAVLKTPNILRQDGEQTFKGKPVIIVSAGPSLDEEIKNLKYIKKHGLAYIFAVGSANKALINNDIIPDAVCTYDPTQLNQVVFEEMINQGVTVPMIFGSSVGYETLQKYNGPKLHMLTSKDPVSFYYLESLENRQILNDAPSIAIITLELLIKLEVSLVILVGQNLGYKNNNIYSKGITYEHRDRELSEEEKSNIVETIDVHGYPMQTSDSFLSMKRGLEHYIQLANCKVINTTIGGAKIDGAPFIPLEEVINAQLQNPVVNPNWHLDFTNTYLDLNLRKKYKEMNDAHEKCQIKLKDINKILFKLEDSITRKNKYLIPKNVSALKLMINDLVNNTFFKVYIHQMMNIGFKAFIDKLNLININNETLVMAGEIKNITKVFLAEVVVCNQLIAPVYKEVQDSVLEGMN